MFRSDNKTAVGSPSAVTRMAGWTGEKMGTQTEEPSVFHAKTQAPAGRNVYRNKSEWQQLIYSKQFKMK